MQKPLIALVLISLVLAAAALAGLFLDPRTITGAPAWEKPLKFGVSIAAYSLSFAWLLGRVEGWPRLTRFLGRATAATLALELLLIDLQAARGTTSHFNVASAFDGVVFTAMGAAIGVLFACQIIAAVLLLRQRFADPVLAWSLRLGMVITVLGAAVGWLMVAQNAHTVGAPDGGAGMALTNWSAWHGDLRPAHFFGLHALQLLPLVGWLASRARGLHERQRVRLVLAAGASYAGLFGLLLWQALRGAPLLSLDGAALAGWALGTALLAGAALVPVRAGSAVEPA